MADIVEIVYLIVAAHDLDIEFPFTFPPERPIEVVVERLLRGELDYAACPHVLDAAHPVLNVFLLSSCRVLNRCGQLEVLGRLSPIRFAVCPEHQVMLGAKGTALVDVVVGDERCIDRHCRECGEGDCEHRSHCPRARAAAVSFGVIRFLSRK